MNLSRFLFRPLAQFPFIAKFVDKSIRSTQTAAADVVELALGQAHRGAQGFYKFSKEAQSDPISNDKSNQNRIWKESATWAGVGANETALAL